MLTKKYLTIKYIAKLCVGVLRFDPVNNTNSLTYVAKLLSYFIETGLSPYSTLNKIYETDHNVYIKVLSLIIDAKILNQSITLVDIHQEIINKIENTIDNNTFSNVFKFVKYIVSHAESDKNNNDLIDIEFDKLFKYILLESSMSEMQELHSNFYEKTDSIVEFDKTISNVFIKYENSFINNDIILSNDEEDIDSAFAAAEAIEGECREVSILRQIKFLEQKRVGILVGASGAGKSMFLCHVASEHLTKPKHDTTKKLIFYFTFENSREETFLRIVANALRIPIDIIKKDAKNPAKRKKLVDAYLKIKDKDTILIIKELSPNRHSMSSVEAHIDKHLAKYSSAIVYSVILDYVDKMLARVVGKNYRTDELLGYIVDDFKALTKHYNTAGFTVSQFNRTGAKKAAEDEDVGGTDIGGGWSKYENADVVILMVVQNTIEELGYSTVSLYIDKHRYYKNGGVFNCVYRPQMALFTAADAGINTTKIRTPTDFTNNEDVFENTSCFN